MNYLNKRDIMIEIDKSKRTYCSFLAPQYCNYHAIVASVDLITSELIEEIVAVRAKPRGKAAPEIVAPENVVIRVMTVDHIPDDEARVIKARNTDRPLLAKTPFPPFKHFILKDNLPVEVGRSHWKGTIEDGQFCITHGRISNGLGMMFLLLVERISRKSNFRNYSYLDEMMSHALVHLSENGLAFDESKSDNPFAFFTTVVNHNFVRIINSEKRHRDILEDLKEIQGGPMSFSRQFEAEDKKLVAPVAKKKARAKSVAKEIKIED